MEMTFCCLIDLYFFIFLIFSYFICITFIIECLQAVDSSVWNDGHIERTVALCCTLLAYNALMPGMSSIVKKEIVTKKETIIKDAGVPKSKNKEKEAEKEAEKAEKEVVDDDDDYKDETRRYENVKFKIKLNSRIIYLIEKRKRFIS